MSVPIRPGMLLATMLGLGACAAPPPIEEPEPTAPLVGGLPDSVTSIADPNQNIATARLQPDDHCYWYLHDGPVETTLLPLRTPDGRPICAPQAAQDTNPPV